MESALIAISEISEQLVGRVDMRFRRRIYGEIDWSQRLVGIKGSRGTGKTTLLLQRLRSLGLGSGEGLYISLDNVFLGNVDVPSLLDIYFKRGGKWLFLDEVHKYPGWSGLLKHLYDVYPDLKIVFTGSSIIDISRQEADLSRRTRMYVLHGLSFREFLEMEHGLQLPDLDLEGLIGDGAGYVKGLGTDFRPLQYFTSYLEMGNYPFYSEDRGGYRQRVLQMIRLIVEYDMAGLPDFDLRNAAKLLKLVAVIAGSVPFKPNISSLAEKTGIHRNTLNQYLHYLSEAQIIHLLHPQTRSTAGLQKPEKIYLENTDLLFALSPAPPNIGNVRETFFVNALKRRHRVDYATRGDFVVDGTYTFEIGGGGKGRKQIEGIENAYVVRDSLVYPVGEVLPLWMFGLIL